MYLVLLPLNIQHEPMQTRVEWRQRLELGVHLAQKQCRMRDSFHRRLNFSSQKYVGKKKIPGLVTYKLITRLQWLRQFTAHKRTGNDLHEVIINEEVGWGRVLNTGDIRNATNFLNRDLRKFGSHLLSANSIGTQSLVWFCIRSVLIFELINEFTAYYVSGSGSIGFVCFGPDPSLFVRIRILPLTSKKVRKTFICTFLLLSTFIYENWFKCTFKK
jgi:hypothetical protein